MPSPDLPGPSSAEALAVSRALADGYRIRTLILDVYADIDADRALVEALNLLAPYPASPARDQIAADITKAAKRNDERKAKRGAA